MPFQKNIDTYPANGAPGLRYGLNPVAYLLPVPLAAGDGVVVGYGVFAGDEAGTVANSGSVFVGIAQRNVTEQIFGNDEATNTIKAGQPVPVITRGDVIVVASAQVTAGHKVFVNTSTGAISGAASGTSVADAVETSWTIKASAAAGVPFIISNW